MGVRTLHLIQRCHRSQGHRGLAGHCETDQHPLDSGQPGRLRDRQPVAATLFGVHTPTNLGIDDQFPKSLNLVGAESEAMRHRRKLTEIEQIDAGGTLRIQIQQFGEHRQYRVDSDGRPRGQLNSQTMTRMEPRARIQTKRCFDQRCVSRDIGAQNDDIAWLQARVVAERSTST